MMQVIWPEIFNNEVVAFFTGKTPGVDLAAVAGLARMKPEHIYMPVQKHTNQVLVLGQEGPEGQKKPEEDGLTGPEVADAVITKRTKVLLGIKVADCVPILLFSQTGGMVAVVHAGWRGTAAGILKKTIREMRRLGAEEDIKAAIGPAVGPCCYEVSRDVADAVVKETGPGDYHTKSGQGIHLDLSAANRAQAVSEGVPHGSIWTLNRCTACNPGSFHSFRRDGEAAGRQGGFIALISKNTKEAQ